MSSILKKLIFVVVFVLVTLVLPCILLLLFVDAANGFSVYVITYGAIIFAILGYVIASVRSMEKKLEDTMEEIKMQNAAIAYKLTNVDNEMAPPPAPQQPLVPEVTEVKEIKEEPAPVVDTSNIPLNPAEPLVMPTEKKAEKVEKVEKVADDGFDDFK